MFRSLRFRLPALLVLGIVLAAVVATLIAVRFFQSNTRTHAASELRAESGGIVGLYKNQAGHGFVSVSNLRLALGVNEVFYVPPVRGAKLLAGPVSELPGSVLPPPGDTNGKPPAFNFQFGGRAYLGVAQP